MSKIQGKSISDSDIITVLAKDIQFKGTLKFKNSLKIKGSFEGNIQALEGLLVIGEEASIQAKITANQVINFGNITGNVEAKEGIEIYRGAKLYGDIVSKELYIEKGALLNGNCKMADQKKVSE